MPDARQKCYKIPPENELCLCEDIFQQHQAKLVNCDVEDAIAVESYKEPTFDSNENVCDDGASNECYCGGVDDESSKSSSEPSVGSDRVDGPAKNERKNSVGATVLPLEVYGGGRTPNKLTAEERDRVLRELDDIVTGNFLTKVRRFSQDLQSSGSSEDHGYGRGRHQQQQLRHMTASARFRGKRSSSLDTDEMINYGRIAELTRRFSRLGEAAPRHYCSQPEFFHDDTSSVGCGSSGDDYEVIRQPIRMVFIGPAAMSVSDNRLNVGVGECCSSGGVVLTEVMSDGENDGLSATQNRRRSFRKSLAFDSSPSSADDGDEASSMAARYRRLKGGAGGWQSVMATDDRHGWQPDGRTVATAVNFGNSSDTVSVSNVGRRRSHRRYSSVDVYDQRAEDKQQQQRRQQLFLDVEKAEKEFRDGLLAEKHRRHKAIREYLANKELLLMKMKSASTGGILRWNQEHQDTLLDDEDPSLLSSSWPLSSQSQQQQQPSPPPPSTFRPVNVRSLSSDKNKDDDTDEDSPKDVLRRVLHTGLKGRPIRRFRKLESRSSGFALADLCRVSNDEPPSSTSSRHDTGCSSAAKPSPDNRNNTL